MSEGAGTRPQQRLKEEDYAFDMWDDEDYGGIIRRYKQLREHLGKLRKEEGLDPKEVAKDVPPHIRDWFENPIYQTLIKPSKCQILGLLRLSTILTLLTFKIGVVLLIFGVFLAVRPGADDRIIALGLLLSGTAGILASLFKAIALVKDIATQYARLQISISAGLISLDALARVLEGQTKLKPYELKTVEEITKALAPLIRAFEKADGQE